VGANVGANVGAEVVTSDARPATAERVRTVCARAATAYVVADGAAPVNTLVHHLLPRGDFALTIRDGSALAARPTATAAVLEFLDHAPPGHDHDDRSGRADRSVRALVWIRGRIRSATPAEVRPILDAVAAANPDPALLEVGRRDRLMMLTVDSAVLADATGAEAVDRSAVARARPDPFCHLESAWVQHLQLRHPDLVERLRLHIPRGMRSGRLRLLGIDRYGLQVRVDGPEGSRDSRVPFFSPVADVASLGRALRSLMGCPLDRGLHKKLG